MAPVSSTVLIQGETRHRQGAGGEGAARPLARGGASRSSRSTAPRCRRRCSRAELFGHEKGAVHRRGRAAAGPVRAGRQRDHLPRRDRRDPAGHPGQAAAGAGEPDLLPGGRHPADQGGRPGHRGHQPAAPRRGRPGRVPRRPLLPAQRPQHLPAAAAGAAGGHPPPGAPVHPRVRQGPRPHLPRHHPGGDAAAGRAPPGPATSASSGT